MEQSNQTGLLGESLASQLMPSATIMPPRNAGFDIQALGGSLIEVKTSRYSTVRQGWRFRIKKAQIETCNWLLLLALNPENKLCCYWIIPKEEINRREIVINELNLRDYQKYLVEVLPDMKTDIKWCYKCHRNKNMNEFTSGLSQCDECHSKPKNTSEYQRAYYLKHRDVLRAKHKAWYYAHKPPAQPRKPRARVVITEKFCPDCNTIKPVADFRTNNGYVRWVCRICENKSGKAYRDKNRARIREKQRRYAQEHKDEINRARRAKWQAAHPIAKRIRRAD